MYLQFSLHLLHSCLFISERLYIRLDSDVLINPILSISFSLYVTSLPFIFVFFNGTLNDMYFSVFSPKQSMP